MQQRMTALKALRYAGKSMKPGDIFSADPRHVRVLTAAKSARIAPAEKVKVAPDAVVRVRPAVVPPRSMEEMIVAGESLPLDQPVEAKPKRTYTRRDLTAES